MTNKFLNFAYCIGEAVEIVSAKGKRVGNGVVSDQKVVHGCELTYGWVPVMVKEIDPDIRPWSDFPTHSNLVEKGSFIAWPKAFLKHVSK